MLIPGATAGNDARPGTVDKAILGIHQIPGQQHAEEKQKYANNRMAKGVVPSALPVRCLQDFDLFF